MDCFFVNKIQNFDSKRTQKRKHCEHDLTYRSNSSVYVKLFIVAILVTSTLVGLPCVDVNKINWSCGFVARYEVKHG